MWDPREGWGLCLPSQPQAAKGLWGVGAWLRCLPLLFVSRVRLVRGQRRL